MRQNTTRRSVFFIFERYAGHVKVTALDEITGKEVVLIGKAGTHRRRLKQLATNKLMRALDIVRDRSTDNRSPYGEQSDMGGWGDAGS